MAGEPWAARCDGLVKVYRSDAVAVEALRGVTAAFPPGALTAVMGPSGSGKSSLLRLLAGMERPTAGTIRVGGVNLHRAGTRRLRRLRRHTIGYVFQRPSDNFVSYLTVDEHLRMAAAGTSPGGPRAGPVLEELGIAARAGHLPADLSGGQQQLAAFAQAVVGGATVIVADEPTAELDGASARLVLDRMRLLVEHGVAFIVATHDRAVARVADRVIYLDEGRVRDRPARPAGPSVAYVREALSPGEPQRVLVAVRGATKSYRRGPETIHAVQGADLDLPAGTILGLVGRSGSGKTTLLNLIAGWEQPDHGAVDRSRLGGMEGLAPSEGPLDGVPWWGRMAILPQRLGLMEELTVRENVEYPARLAGVAEQTAPRVEELLDALGLAELADRYPRETSVGEQQRSALARALVLRPGVLLLDEPTGHQDHRSAALVLDLLRDAAAEGTCCLVATHDEEAAGRFDRMVRIEDGILSQS